MVVCCMDAVWIYWCTVLYLPHTVTHHRATASLNLESIIGKYNIVSLISDTLAAQFVVYVLLYCTTALVSAVLLVL